MVVLAVATTRFLNPYAEIIFTPVLIVRRRDGVDYLLMRLSHSLGHLLTDVNIVVRRISLARASKRAAKPRCAAAPC